jgi:flagellar hook-associated protein 3 FlgL
MFRVANFAQHQLTLSYAMRTQSSLAERQIEIASGKRAQLYSSISSQASELVNVERAVARSTQFSRNIDQALTRLGIMESSVGIMVQRATEVLAIMSLGDVGREHQRRAAAGVRCDFPGGDRIAAQYPARGPLPLRRLADEQSGPSTSRIPPTRPQTGLPGVFTADFDYYQGDDLRLTVRTAETFETSLRRDCQRAGLRGDAARPRLHGLRRRKPGRCGPAGSLFADEVCGRRPQRRARPHRRQLQGPGVRQGRP